MLRSRLPQIVLEIELRTERAIEAGAEHVKNAAKDRVRPHRVSGQLEEAIHVQEEPEGFYVVAGGGDEHVFWGHLLENGTTHSAPYPFLTPALEESRDVIVRSVGAALRGL
jgi:HK97 gp10 family phage protein